MQLCDRVALHHKQWIAIVAKLHGLNTARIKEVIRGAMETRDASTCLPDCDIQPLTALAHENILE